MKSKQDDIILGIDVKTGLPVCIRQSDRCQGLYGIGKPGTGKTTFEVHLILQDIAAGMGVCFLDPHGDAITDILRRLPVHRKNDVILLDVLDSAFPFGLNLYECADPTDPIAVQDTVEGVMHVFEKLFDMSRSTPRMAQYMRNCAYTLIANPGTTMAEIPLLLTDEIARTKLVAHVSNPQVKVFWRHYNQMSARERREQADSTLNKLDEFLSQTIVANIVGQSKTTINFREIMDKGKILLVKLPGQYENIASLIGCIIIGQLLHATLSRKDTDEDERKRHQFNLYCDEFQRFATQDMAKLLAEARKYAVATTIAHQFRDQLDEANRGATLIAVNLVVFCVSGVDGEELAKNFDATPPEPISTGERPKRVPTRDAVSHLVKNGHSNDAAVHEFITLYLQPIVAMTNPRSDEIYVDTAKLGMVKHLYYSGMKPSIRSPLSYLNALLYEVMRDHNTAKDIPHEIYLGFSNLGFYNLLVDDAQLVQAALYPQTEAQRIAALQKLRKHPDKQAALEKLLHFRTSLLTLIDVLAHDPIEVDSGQWEIIPDKPRTYQDVQNQVANELANLPKFIAKVKAIGADNSTVEHTIKTLPLAPGMTNDLFTLMQRDIQEATQSRYCVPRIKVEEEIRRRQEELMQEKPQEKRREDEEEI